MSDDETTENSLDLRNSTVSCKDGISPDQETSTGSENDLASKSVSSRGNTKGVSYRIDNIENIFDSVSSASRLDP